MQLYYLLIFILLVVLASPPLAGAASLLWTCLPPFSNDRAGPPQRVQNDPWLFSQA